MDNIEKILNAVLDTSEKVDKIDQRLIRVENIVDNSYNKMDGFLILINRHEAEISALRLKCDRLEDRLNKLETS